MKRFSVIILLILFCGTGAFAGTTTYTNEANFLAGVNSYYLEDFNGYSYGVPFNGTQFSANFGPVNGFSWTASSPNGLFSLNGSLSINVATDLLTITFTGAPVTAVGGIFMSTEFGGNIIDELVMVTLSNGTSMSLTGSGFMGFISDLPILSLTIDGLDNPSSNWPAVDHFYAGNAVPEPASMLLLGSGIAGLLARRKLRK